MSNKRASGGYHTPPSLSDPRDPAGKRDAGGINSSPRFSNPQTASDSGFLRPPTPIPATDGFRSPYHDNVLVVPFEFRGSARPR